jgi:GNAT superfamily N-acetyltransferase
MRYKNISNLLNIRLATLDDLNNINLLFEKVIKDMDNIKKMNMWNSIYPFCEFKKDIKKQNMYLIENENKIIGSFTLIEYDDLENYVINWTSNNKKWFYITRLVILPSEQGKGYAKIAMKFINKYAIENNYEIIRLTVYKNNKYAIGLYEKFGFVKIKNSHLVIKDKIFIGFEKEVSRTNIYKL